MKLLASSPTIGGLIDLICKYFYTDSITLHESGALGNSKGFIERVR